LFTTPKKEEKNVNKYLRSRRSGMVGPSLLDQMQEEAFSLSQTIGRATDHY
jgi:hypothetical protein